MENEIKTLIKELEGAQSPFVTLHGKVDSEAKVNVWYVIAKLQKILLENEETKKK